MKMKILANEMERSLKKERTVPMRLCGKQGGGFVMGGACDLTAAEE